MMEALKKSLFLICMLALIVSGCVSPATTPPPSGVVETAPPQAAATSAPVTAPTSAPAITEAPTVGAPVVLKIGWPGKPDTLNPAYAFLTESYTIFDLVYGGLTTESPTGEYVGELAKEWKNSDDGLVWTFTLKDGIKFHTGEDFTADDMAWAINAIMADPDGWATLANYTSGFKEVKALDPKTLQITLEQPISNMEYRVSFLYALYPKDFEGFKTAEELQNFPNDMPIGTGAFKMNTFDKDKGILILDANRDFYGQAPKVDQVIFQTFDNADAMVQALKVGDVDVVMEIPNSAFDTLKDVENLKLINQPGRGLAELIINSVPADNDPPPNRNPALEYPQVRLALATAINKQDLVDIVLQGYGAPGVTIIPPSLGGGFWYNPIQDVTFDLDKANQILEDAGYIKGSDGIRVKGDVKLEFRLQYASDSTVYPRVADLISNWYRQIGVKANPESVDPDSLTAAVTPTGDYDLVIWGWGSDPDPDFMLSVMTSDQFVDGGWSDSGYSNPEYDQLYLDQQTAIDKNERQKIVWKMQEMVYNDRPYIILYYERTLEAYRSDRFKNFIDSPLGIEISLSLRQVEPVK
jgi:peptide/nickel transport system substrate-binding protein